MRRFPTLGLILLTLAPTLAVAGDGPTRSRTFKLTYRAEVREIPEGAKSLDLWLPIPQSDRNQTIDQIRIDAPGLLRLGRDATTGNQDLHLSIPYPQAPVVVRLEIEATRRENSGGEVSLTEDERSRSLRPEPLVPIDGPVRALAEEATRGLSTDLEKARAIYERVTGMMTYDKSGIGWGRGDALFACDAKRGNCTDFHALIIGMCRSVGIPARFAIGLPLPEARGSGEIPGYHCWAELYVEGRGWVPVDSSEASKDSSKRDYYFGHHDENRLEFSRGRQLMLAPPQQGPRLNFFVYPYAEVDGKPYPTIERKLTFVDREPSPTSSKDRP